MTIKSLCPSVDWFFVTKPTPPQNETSVWHIAAWAVNEEGEVFGMVSVPKINLDNKCSTPTLVSAPPVNGVYKHLRELNEVEKRALDTGEPVEVDASK